MLQWSLLVSSVISANKNLTQISFKEPLIITSWKLNKLSVSETLNLQRRLQDSLQRTWRKSLSLDWIPVKKARTFPLKEYYVGLRWARVVHRAIKSFKQELTNIYDILTIAEPKWRYLWLRTFLLKVKKLSFVPFNNPSVKENITETKLSEITKIFCVKNI